MLLYEIPLESFLSNEIFVPCVVFPGQSILGALIGDWGRAGLSGACIASCNVRSLWFAAYNAIMLSKTAILWSGKPWTLSVANMHN